MKKILLFLCAIALCCSSCKEKHPTDIVNFVKVYSGMRNDSDRYTIRLRNGEKITSGLFRCYLEDVSPGNEESLVFLRFENENARVSQFAILTEDLHKFPDFEKAAAKADKRMREGGPEIVVLIDYETRYSPIASKSKISKITHFWDITGMKYKKDFSNLTPEMIKVKGIKERINSKPIKL